jgi:hypothetical protein
MPTTTTNFGWTVPADTDLVKDGAAAIRTALGGVDTSFLDLKGGTTGQVLAKASGTDLDYSWTTPSSGSTFAGCRLYKDAGQTIADATQTAVTFNQETYDTNTYHDNSTNTSRITIPATKAGYYLFVCKWSLGENPTGYRQVELRKNNSAMDRTSIRGTSSGQNFVILSTVQSAAVDDYFEFFVYQTSGENLGVEAGTLQTVFTAAYLGA